MGLPVSSFAGELCECVVRFGGWLVVERDRFAGGVTLSLSTYIGKPGCPFRGRLHEDPIDECRRRDRRTQIEFGGSRNRTANLEAVPGKSCRPPLATDSPGLTDELPQVVPRSGRRHGNRRRRDTRALTRPPSPPEEERFPSSSTAGVPESILRQFHNDPRQFAMIPDREKNDGEFGSG